MMDEEEAEMELSSDLPPTPESQNSLDISRDVNRNQDRIVQVGIPDYTRYLCSALRNLRENPGNVDGYILLKNRPIPVHRCLVSSFSEFLAESFARSCTGVIFIDDIDDDVMEAILDFIYRNMAVLREHRLLDFLKATRKLKIECLQTPGLLELEQYLVKRKTTESAGHTLPSSVSLVRVEDKKKTEPKPLMTVKNIASHTPERVLEMHVEKSSESMKERRSGHCCCKREQEDEVEDKAAEDEENKTLTISKKLKQLGTVITGGGVSLKDVPAWLFSSKNITLQPAQHPSSAASSDGHHTAVSGSTRGFSATPSLSNKLRYQTLEQTRGLTPSPVSSRSTSRSLPASLPLNVSLDEPVVISEKVNIKRNPESRFSHAQQRGRGTTRRIATCVSGRVPTMPTTTPAPSVSGFGRGYVTNQRQQSSYSSARYRGHEKIIYSTRGRPRGTYKGVDSRTPAPQYQRLGCSSSTATYQPVKSPPNTTAAGSGTGILEIIDTGLTISVPESALEVLPFCHVDPNLNLKGTGVKKSTDNTKTPTEEPPPPASDTVHNSSPDSNVESDLPDLNADGELNLTHLLKDNDSQDSFRGFGNGPGGQEVASGDVTSEIPVSTHNATETNTDAKGPDEKEENRQPGSGSGSEDWSLTPLEMVETGQEFRGSYPEDRQENRSSNEANGDADQPLNDTLKIVKKNKSSNKANGDAEQPPNEAKSQPDGKTTSDKAAMSKGSKKVKRQKCCICQKFFMNRASLTMHLRIHENRRPYCCSSCPFHTEQLWKMKKHVWLKHKRGVVDSETKVKEVPKPLLLGRKPGRPAKTSQERPEENTTKEKTDQLDKDLRMKTQPSTSKGTDHTPKEDEEEEGQDSASDTADSEAETA